MRDEWKQMTLREAGVSLIDCDHRTPPAAAGGYPYVAIPQLKQGRIVLSDVRHITKSHFFEWTKKNRPRPYDVVVSRRCNPGETAFVPQGLEFALGQNLVLLRSDDSKVFPPFLRWLLRSQGWWEQVGKFINVGAVFDSLRCADIPNFQLLFPPLPEQQAIADILGSLDDKIELNRRMNETLESMARALFKSWFVDFDPVVAKSEGRHPEGMDAETAKLFPDSFEDSEIGRIPKGWQVGTFGDVANSRREVVGVGNLPPDFAYIGLEHMPRRCIALSEWGNASSVESAKSRFNKGDVLFGKLRPYFHKVGIAPVDGICSTDILVITPRKAEWSAFVLGYASSDEMVDHADSCSTGTRMPRVSWGDLSRYLIPLPQPQLAGRFSQIVAPFLDKIAANTHESLSLMNMRDTLLPRLLSGEVSTPSSKAV